MEDKIKQTTLILKGLLLVMEEGLIITATDQEKAEMKALIEFWEAELLKQ